MSDKIILLKNILGTREPLQLLHFSKLFHKATYQSYTPTLSPY